MKRCAASVVMAAHNGERFLDEQLASILGQLREEDELIVVDDASTDKTPSILRSWSGPQLRVVRNPRNLGVRKSFELGLSMARHSIVFLSDQDDVWSPGKRDAFVSAFAGDVRVSLVLSDAEVIDARGSTVALSFMARRGGFKADFLSNLVRNRFLGCAMAIHRRVLEVALPIPPRVPQHDIWLGAVGALTGSVRFLPPAYLRYRRHDANLSPARPAPLVKMLWWRFMLLTAVATRLTRHKLFGPGPR